MGNKLKMKWWEFHKDNPQIYQLLEKFTMQVIRRGFKNYSINAIFERIRWHTDIETTDPSFKLSNNHRAYYARYFHAQHPEYSDFFRTKELHGE
jgi:hypothetical protein